MTDQPATPPALPHHEAVKRLDAAFAGLLSDRERCRESLRRGIEAEGGSADLVELVTDIADEYGAAVERRMNDLIPFALRYPEAWDASEAGRCQRELLQEFQRVVDESMALLFGAGRSTGRQAR